MTRTARVPEVGRRLAAARLQRGLAQKDVARSAGVAASYLSRVENGKVQPTLKSVMHLAHALGADLTEIVGPSASVSASRGPCPVTSKGQCLLDLIAPRKEHGSFTPREVRLLRKFAHWVERADSARLRAIEVLLEDLSGALED